MTATYYWYAWTISIIAYFFIQKSQLRLKILLFTGISMSTYSLSFWNGQQHFYLHIAVLGFFGLIFWTSRNRGWIEHFWPFVLSIGYTSFQLFFMVNPVWLELPGIPIGLIAVLLLLKYFCRDLEGLIGMWLLMVAIGTLCSYLILSLYSDGGVFFNNQILLLAAQGILILLFFHGLEKLKSMNKKKRIQRINKGAALM
ncbi:YphA family membrane protein [Halobacillus mangrovi]|uniref:Uncharacterized protein n=1 Tax=Halobacillus mangrovi TaxID=402384 RepID=A0A1W5ZVC4_9BACI|nr:hypothetical protein [Halobacillus mangrovi]ARI77238.1 hypothetical protein HM131_10475 [Halobacillus mangrovi]